MDTEGILEIKGTVRDEHTEAPLPGRKIIVNGLIGYNNQVTIDAGLFSTDSTGSFSYSLKKIKDAYYYNFCLVGDTDYAFRTVRLGLVELGKNAKYLNFTLSKLVDLTIKIQKTSKLPFRDTLYLRWESDKTDYRILYPYKVENYGINDNTFFRCLV